MHAQAVREVVGHLQLAGQTVHACADGGTLLIVVAEGETVASLFTTTRHREVVVGHPSILLHLIEPVGVLVIFVVVLVVGVIVDGVCIEQHVHFVTCALHTLGVGSVPESVLHHGCVLTSVEQRNGGWLLLDGPLGREVELGLAHGTLLGIDDKHTIGTLGTIDGCSGSILEHIDALDVGWGNVQQGTEVF